MFRDAWARLWSELRRSDRRREVDEELALHVELLAKRYEAEGRDPASARQAALRRFGDVGSVARQVERIDAVRHRRRRRKEVGGALKLDLRYARRQLTGSPGLSIAVMSTLALGIGVNVAMFSLLEGVVLRRLPYAEPDRLVAVWPSKNMNMAMMDVFGSAAPSLESVSGLAYWSLTLLGDGDAEPEVVEAAVVGTNLFDVLGVHPALGRSFTPEQRDPSASGVVILTHGFWTRRFGGDPSVVGRMIQLEGYDHGSREIIGVLPPSHRPLRHSPDVYVPLHVARGRTVSTDSTWYVNDVIARLAPGVTADRAAAEVRTVAARIRTDHPSSADDDEVARATVVPLADALVGEARRTLWVLVGAVGLVLLIACLNVANLLLARGHRRDPEVSLRKALGATRRRIVVQQLTETGMLAAVGGAAGLAVCAGLLAVLEPRVVERLPRVTELSLNGRVLAFAVSATFLVALLSGLAPAIRSAAREAAEGLRGVTPSVAGRRRGALLNRSLVAVELALAVVLVSGAALTVRSFRGLASTDPGFQSEGVLAMRVAPPPARYAARDAQGIYQARLLEQLRGLPEVASVGSNHLLPLSWGNWAFPYLAEGHEPPADAPLPSANFRVVSPGYFETMRIPLHRGRDFTDADGPRAPDVGIINHALAEELWPGQDPIGKEIQLFGNAPFTVVGVVGDIRQTALDRDPLPEMYVPMAQFPLASTVYMIRARAGLDPGSLAPALRNAVWAVDEDVPIPMLQPLEVVVGESVATERLVASLLTAFAGLALVLGMVGVYGVMAYVMGGRTREFAIRTALGASRFEVERQALADGLGPLVLGLGLGLGATLATGRVLDGLLHDVEPADPVTLGGVLAVLTIATVAASWLPARRAARTEAARALRE